MKPWELMTQMWTLLRGMIEEAAPCFESHGLIPKAFFLLVQVERYPYPADLAWCLLLPPPTVSQLIRQLEEAGYLTREIDAADKRRVRLKLTEAGRDVRAAVQECLNCSLQRRIDRLSPAQLEQLVALIHDIETRTEDGRIKGVQATSDITE